MAFGSSASCATISASSTWNREPCNPSTTPSGRGCHPCLRYDLSPMCPGRTRRSAKHESNTAPIPATIARVSESACLTTPFPFLGVTRSVLGRAWVDRCEPTRAMAATAIAQTHGLPDVLARVLAGRGIGVRDAPRFLEPRLRDLLPDPNILRDMDAAAARLAEAVVRGETVAIFGDYD